MCIWRSEDNFLPAAKWVLGTEVMLLAWWQVSLPSKPSYRPLFKILSQGLTKLSDLNLPCSIA